MAAEPSAPKSEFPATFARCLLGMVIAIALGCFIGYGVLLMIGEDTDLTVSNRYMDRVYLCRSGFVQQNLEYQQAADALRRHPGVRVLRTAGGAPVYWLDGQRVAPDALMDGSFSAAIDQLFAGSAEALVGQSAITEEDISDLLLYNIAVDELGSVYYYLYYDTLGYICIIYDDSGAYADSQTAITLMEQWYLMFDYRELDA